MRHSAFIGPLCMVLGVCAGDAVAQPSFVNWETPQVHPLAITPDGSRLLAVNTPDARLEVFDIDGPLRGGWLAPAAGNPSPAGNPPPRRGLRGGFLVRRGSVPVGLDPVSVRARTNTEVWVVCHVSDAVNIVDLTTLNVVASLDTDDEPCDVVFAGLPQRAFVSCSQANTVLVFDPLNPQAPPLRVPIDAEDPRAMAVSLDGGDVYVAIFESGNGSTILGGGSTIGNGYPPNVVNDPLGPYGGVNPPPNSGTSFNPPINPSLPPPPRVGLIVKKDAGGRWMDDNGGDWTNLVSGPNAARSGRPVGWDLPDRDVALINANTLAVRYATRLMNLCMDLAVNPASGLITVVGTDCTNQIRFEPVIRGRFLRVHMATVNPAGPSTLGVVDLNPHLDYSGPSVPPAVRQESIGDPRGMVWNAAGTKAYVSGMGSNNLIVVDAAGNRVGASPTIEVGEGPTGVVLDEGRNRLYVLNRFEASISVVDLVSETELTRVPLYDPTPAAIRIGRKHLYDTHRNSGLGHVACASCHVDARMDRLGWDLGNPAGNMKPFNQNCGNGLDNGCQPWHPMKGPMTTQTLQDIIGKEPHHWRGDREGLEAFRPAFVTLQGADAEPTPQDTQEFEDFLATVHFPPNPFRGFDNSLPTNLPLPGHYTTGRFGPEGLPLPNGNAQAGLNSYRTRGLDRGINCVTCHTLPTGVGSNLRFQSGQFVPFPTGPNGELHHAVVSVDGSTNVTMKISQLRNMHEKVGFEATQTNNNAGFGFLHDGSVDSLARFVTEPVFNPANDQEVANLVAFMLAFSGSDLPMGSTTNPAELLGPTSDDTHAAVGTQTTLVDAGAAPAGQLALIDAMVALAGAGDVGLVVKGRRLGLQRGYAYVGADQFQSDRLAEAPTRAELLAAAAPGSELTFTVVPLGTQTRLGIDRDEDGFYDRDELDGCADPADPASVPGGPASLGDFDCDGDVDLSDFTVFQLCFGGSGNPPAPTCPPGVDADLDGDGDVDLADFLVFQQNFTGSM